MNNKKGATMHPSNKVTLENLKKVVYWNKPNADAIRKFEIIADACYDSCKAVLEYDFRDTEPILSALRNFVHVVFFNTPQCRDSERALDWLFQTIIKVGGEKPFDFTKQDIIECLRSVRMLANSAIALDPDNAMEIDHERGNDWEIVPEPVKYSVDIWLSKMPTGGIKKLELCDFLFGDVEWSSEKFGESDKKYRITVEEVE